MSESKNLELRSPEIRKILEEKPSRLITWGTLFIIVSITAILLTAWFIKYPDIVKSEVVISDATPPIPITAKMQGLLGNIFVEEGEVVEKNQRLGMIKNAATYEAIKEVEDILGLFQANNSSTYYLMDSLQFEQSDEFGLGEVGASFNFLKSALKEFQIDKSSPETAIKINNLQNRIKNLRTLIKANSGKIQALERRVNVNVSLVDSKQNDYGKGKLTLAEFEKFIADLENARQDLISFESSLESKKSEITSLETQINLIRQGDIKESSFAFENIKEKTDYLKNQLDKWREKYLLVAPEGGIISFYENKIDTKKFFQTDEKIMAILPETTSELIGKVSLDIRHNGKVLEEQDVLIKLASYPYQEFGKLRGKVRYKADIPKDDFVNVEIELTNGLITTNEKSIPQDRQLIGTAEIVTENKRLFQRIYEKVF